MTAATTVVSRANALPILIAASVMMSLAMGMRQCLGLFLPPMTQALAMSAPDFTFAIAVQNIVGGLAAAPLGAVADRWGLRPVMVLGAMAYVAAMATMTAATGVWMFVLAQSFVGVGIACTGSSLAMTATARAASPERRSVVLGIVGAFSSVGTLVIAPVLQGLLGAWDWRWGAVLFVILALAMVPAAAITGRVDRLSQPSLPRAAAGAGGAGERRGAAQPPLRRPVLHAFRLRAAADLHQHAPAELPGAVRPGPDAGRHGARHHRRHQHRGLPDGR